MVRSWPQHVASCCATADGTRDLTAPPPIRPSKTLTRWGLAPAAAVRPRAQASSAKFWTVVLLFACATPVGIGVGYAFSVGGPSKLAAAMSALASGTFLYVAVMEVIPKELADPAHRLPKMGMLLLGFGLMSLLAVWA